MSNIELKNTKYLEVRDSIDEELLHEHSFPVAPNDYLVDGSPNGRTTIYKVLDVYYADVTTKFEDGKKLDEPKKTGEKIVVKVFSIIGHDEGRELTKDLSDLLYSGYAVSKKDPREYEEDALKEYVFGDGFTTPYDNNIEEESTETAIAKVDKKYLEEHKNKLALRQNHLKCKFGLIESHLQSKRSQFLSIKRELEEKLSKVAKVIKTIELYLGINEDIVEVNNGEEAPEGTPLHMRQRIIYMNEEVADPENEGLDFRNVDDFYSWLTDYNEYWDCLNYEITIPEERCILAVQIRRKNKDYSDNPFVNFHMNQHNKQTCFLIRNGECLYAVWADTRVTPRLFPAEDEFLELQEQIIEDDFDFSGSKEKFEKKLKDQIFKYKMYILVLQGLMHRTNIYGREFSDINLLDLNVEESDEIKFIYDDTQQTLRNPHTDYKEWKEKINSKIEEGTRILVVPPRSVGRYYSYSSDSRRYWREERKPFYVGDRSIPDPDTGIYSVEERDLPNMFRESSDESGYFIKYLPSDEVWDEYEGFRKRKRKESFRIYKNDTFVINYDLVYEEDLDFLVDMIHDRTNRKDYLSIVPMLLTLIEKKREELEDESPFWNLIANEVNKLLSEYDFPVIEDKEYLIEEYVKPACRWWKLKNKWTRSLTSDDSKALRMIKKKVKDEVIENEVSSTDKVQFINKVVKEDGS